MRKHKLVRLAVYGVAGLLVLGSIGYAANGGFSNKSHTATGAVPGDEFAVGGTNGSSESMAGPLSLDGSTASIAPAPPMQDGVVASANGKSGGTAMSVAGAGSSSAKPGSAPAAQAPASSGSDALASTDNRKIVQTATMSLQVKDVSGSFEDVGRIATGAGGFVASSSFAYKGEQQIASVTIRVPASAYQSVLGDLRALGVKVDSEGSTTSDVTDEYTDLGSRQRTLEATYTQLLTLLNKATTVADILTVQDRLNDVQGQIEQIKGRIQLLDSLSDEATITLHLTPAVAVQNTEPGGSNTNLGHAVSDGWNSSIDFLGGIVAGVVKAAVFAWWIPLAGIPVLLVFWALTRHREPAMRSVD